MIINLHLTLRVTPDRERKRQTISSGRYLSDIVDY